MLSKKHKHLPLFQLLQEGQGYQLPRVRPTRVQNNFRKIKHCFLLLPEFSSNSISLYLLPRPSLCLKVNPRELGNANGKLLQSDLL